MPTIKLKVKVPKILVKTTNTNFNITAQNAKNNAIASIRSSNKSGTHYKHQYTNRSSAPYQPPASQPTKYGEDVAKPLEKSISYRIVKTKNSHSFVLSADTPYARRLELGGPNKKGRNIVERPYLEPAIRKAFKRYKSIAKINDFISVIRVK